jgi:hypothetical protein
METKEIDGTQFVKNYNRRPLTLWQLIGLWAGVLIIAFFVVRLAM